MNRFRANRTDRRAKAAHDRKKKPALEMKLRRGKGQEDRPWDILFVLKSPPPTGNRWPYKGYLTCPGRPNTLVAEGHLTEQEVLTQDMDQATADLNAQVFAWGLGLADHTALRFRYHLRPGVIAEVDDKGETYVVLSDQDQVVRCWEWSVGFEYEREPGRFALVVAGGIATGTEQQVEEEASTAMWEWLTANAQELQDSVTRRLGLPVKGAR
jgi:hypothetical protein